ncbi:MAG: hypothetical protein ACFBSF_05350 [Leptolyngbyaceae cyanobacterium]
MWTARNEKLENHRGLKSVIQFDNSAVTYAEGLQRWQTDESFRSFFIKLLFDSPYAAFRWETPSLTVATVNRPFEFVLLDSPSLDRMPEPEVFADHFDEANPSDVVEFSNLGGDAILVVPCPIAPATAYGHLGAFIRQAPESQKHTLWQRVGSAMQRRLGTRPVWLSTAGGGVSWLHVRLDDRPKYYGYTPWRSV